jgi:hypothetical protein
MPTPPALPPLPTLELEGGVAQGTRRVTQPPPRCIITDEGRKTFMEIEVAPFFDDLMSELSNPEATPESILQAFEDNLRAAVEQHFELK